MAVETAINEIRTSARNDISFLPATDMSGGTLVKSTHGCQRIIVNLRRDTVERAADRANASLLICALRKSA